MYNNKEDIIENYMRDIESRMPFISTKDKIKIRKMAEERYIDKTLTLNNSYRCEEREMRASKFLTEVLEENIIMNENGMFFRRAENKDDLSPVVECETYFGKDRNAKKSLMKYFLDVKRGNDIMKAVYNDRAQNNDKTLMNIYYGASLVPTGPFANVDIAETITNRGRNMVAVSALTVEGLFGGLKPNSIDGILYYIEFGGRYSSDDFKALSKLKYTDEDIISSFKDIKNEYKDIMRGVLKHKSQNEKNAMMVRNNFKCWLEVETVFEAIKDLFKYLNKTNSAFLNPYIDPTVKMKPDSGLPENYNAVVVEKLNVIRVYVRMLHGFMWYQENINRYNEMISNPEEMIKEIDRYFVALIDTDSNMIAAMLRDLSRLFNNYLSHLNMVDLEFTYTNLIAVITDEAVKTSMTNYTEALNVPEELRSRVAMKNEYYYSDFCLTSKKKNYAALMCIKEGVAFPKPKLDVKGLMFIKSVVNEKTAAKIENIVENMMLRSKKIDVKAILLELENCAEEMNEILKTEEGSSYYTSEKLTNKLVDMLPSQARAKSVELYNILGLGERISPPSKFYTIKVDLDLATDENIMSRFELFKRVYEIHNNLRQYTDFDIDKCVKAYAKKVTGDILDIAINISNTLNTLLDEVILEMPDLELFVSSYLSSNRIPEVRLTREDIYNKILNDNNLDFEKAHLHLDKIEGYLRTRMVADNARIDYKTKNKKKHFNYKALKNSDFTRLSMPEDMIGNLHPFILDVLNTVKDVTSIDNLSALVVANTNLSIMRNNANTQLISNVLNIY